MFSIHLGHSQREIRSTEFKRAYSPLVGNCWDEKQPFCGTFDHLFRNCRRRPSTCNITRITCRSRLTYLVNCRSVHWCGWSPLNEMSLPALRLHASIAAWSMRGHSDPISFFLCRHHGLYGWAREINQALNVMERRVIAILRRDMKIVDDLASFIKKPKNIQKSVYGVSRIQKGVS